MRDAETGAGIKRYEVQILTIDLDTGELKALPQRRLMHDEYLNISLDVNVKAQKISIIADGYEPFESRMFRAEERAVYDYEVNLIPAKVPVEVPKATVLQANGEPLVGAGFTALSPTWVWRSGMAKFLSVVTTLTGCLPTPRAGSPSRG